MNDKKGLIWISAGELSGDMHGAWLMREMLEQDSGLAFAGMGGPYMRSEKAFNACFGTEELSVMGLTEVLRQLPSILLLLRRIKEQLERLRPKALILIDAPSFHFRVIKIARRLGIPVYYYISPKAWAWKESRALFIKENVRRLISILPFEVDFYKRFGMDIDYVGNPLLDMIEREDLSAISPVVGKIGLLPGSRKKEIYSLVPEFGKAARILHERLPQLDFHMIRAPGIDETELLNLWPGDVPLVLESPDRRYALMKSCEMLIAASGTVTLEAALIGTPTLVAYKVSPITFALGRIVVRIPYVSLSNLILGKALFPELLQADCDGPNLARKALEWLSPSEGGNPLAFVREELGILRSKVGEAGAARRAAAVILDDMLTLPEIEVYHD